VLLEALRNFPGTVVFVSHDRHFIDGLATRVVEVGGGKLESFHGDYEYYLEKVAQRDAGSPGPGLAAGSGRPAEGNSASGTAAARASASEPGSKEERQRQREEDKLRQKGERARERSLAELESRIAAREEELAGLERAMGEPDFFKDLEAARLAGERHAALTIEIAALYEAWETA
jgi:ATP-binding cassette subfamily F protein 3